MYQMRQNRRLIAGTGANFQHPGLRRQFEQFRHSRHHIGLRNRLTLAYRQSDIFPGLMFKRFIINFSRGTAASALSTCSSLMPCARNCSRRACTRPLTIACQLPRCLTSLKPHHARCARLNPHARRDGDVAFIHRREIGIRPGIVFIAWRAIQYNVLPRGSSCGITLSLDGGYHSESRGCFNLR
ncbi:Uncharacterised protein [Salmonella enterica subsp. enterica]|nr:Uncharacterised protein [Salmonella enterica subsp. enterica]